MARTAAPVTPGPAGSGVIVERRPWGLALTSRAWFQRLVVWSALILAWHLVAEIRGSTFLATPLETLQGLVRLQTEGYLSTVLTSLRQLLVGFGLAVAVGVPLGLLMGSVRAVDDFLAPYVTTLFVTSKEALLPLLITLFGTRLSFRIAVVFLFSIFFIVMNTTAGVRSVDRRLIETASAFRVRRRHVFTKVVVPGSLPYIVAGVRLGLGTAIKGMVIAELWVTFGIGLLLKNFGAFRRLDMFFALSAVIIAIGVASTSLLRALEQRLRPWAQARGTP